MGGKLRAALVGATLAAACALAGSGTAVAAATSGHPAATHRSGANPVPAGDVAVAGGIPITVGAIHHWMYIYSKGLDENTTKVLVPLYPPDFTQCIGQARRLYPLMRPWSAGRLLTTCRQLFGYEEPAMLTLLIKRDWIIAQADHLGIVYSSAEAAQDLNGRFRATGVNETEELEIFKHEGLRLADAVAQQRTAGLRQRIIARYTAPTTAAEIAAYYAAHRPQLVVPGTRTLWLVQANTRAEALAARAALRDGASWLTVTRRYDETSFYGGLLTDQTAAELGRGVLAASVFSAPVGKLEGPVADEYGWYVFDVLSGVPQRSLTLAEATPKVRLILDRRHGQAAQVEARRLLVANWKPSTACAAFYRSPDCS